MPRRTPQYEGHGATVPQAPYAYTPFAQRLGAADQHSYEQPIPKNPGWYMTFWEGNQLPGVQFHTAPAPTNYRYMEQRSAQRTGAAFGGGWMGSVSTFNLLERIRTAWASQSGS